MLEAQGEDGPYTLANIFYKAGGIDTIRAQAAEVARDHYPDTFFRSRGENPQGGAGAGQTQKGDVYKGKVLGFNSKSDRACNAFNYGQPHLAKHVDASGHCIHNHICDKFLTTGGKCGAAHPRFKCDNPDKVGQA